VPDHVLGRGLLEQIALPRRVRTRIISAENPTGRRGGGAQAVPDPTNPDLPHSSLALDLGRGFKVRPFGWCRSHESYTLADIEGAGVIRHLWIATDVPDMSTLRLRMYWDGTNTPAVDVSLANFFCLGGPGQGNQVQSLPIVVGPVRGCSSFWTMPFQSGAVLEITNEGGSDAKIVAYSVTYDEVDSNDFGGSRFHARTVSGQPDPKTWEFDIATIDGAGTYVGTSINWKATSPRWWGEGEVKVYLGDDEFPTMVFTGTEDYFGGAWGFARDANMVPGGPHVEQPFSTWYAGAPVVQTNEGYTREIVLYRWHLQDPIGFEDGCRVAVQVLGQGPDDRYEVRADHLQATGFWYAHQVEVNGS